MTHSDKTETDILETHTPQQRRAASNKGASLTGDSANLVLVDSNSRKIYFKGSDVCNVSVPGASAAGVDTLLKKAKGSIGEKNVNRVVMHLGTIDVSKNKNDPNQAILEITTAVGEVHREYQRRRSHFLVLFLEEESQRQLKI